MISRHRDHPPTRRTATACIALGLLLAACDHEPGQAPPCEKSSDCGACESCSDSACVPAPDMPGCDTDRCGNGIVDVDETCDVAITAGLAGACATMCDDGVGCTSDLLVGSACTTACVLTPITMCADDDQCCPAGCNVTTDSDCSPTCGDGAVDVNETCDAAIPQGETGACPTSCSDGVACTQDTLVGATATCSAACSFAAITQCVNGDGCCPAACNANTDSDCSPTCGNGAVESGESCDTAIADGNPGACPTACSDGVACTQDNLVGGGCSAACSFPAISECADGDGCCPAACNANTDDDCSPSCGNGTVESGELCDTAIAAGNPGACPTSCTDTDTCTQNNLVGAGCTAECSFPAITGCEDGDGCCASGCNATSDSDCLPVHLVGAATTVCSGTFWPPTLATGGNAFAVGCMRDGSQNERPNVVVIDDTGTKHDSPWFFLADGYYYTDVQVTYFDNRFQVTYQYNCDDNGSWLEGWGWGCIDFSEYSTTGSEVTSSIHFGQAGHNGHPVLDQGGTDLGFAWVSYDDVYFRRISSARQLVGTSNTLLGADPQQSDARDAARTKIAWDGTGWGVFSIMGGKMYFVRVNDSGSVVVTIKELFGAYSQTFGGQFQVLARDGSYYVLYDETATVTKLAKVSLAGAVSATITIQSGTDFRYPAMLERNGTFYVFTNDAAKHLVVTLVDGALTVDTLHTGVVNSAAVMRTAAPAYDPATGKAAIAFLDANGNVLFQQLSF